MKLYFTERYAKRWFFTALLMELSGLYSFCTKATSIEHVLFCLCGGTVLLFTLGYPFFLRIVTDYYPSGFRSPIEKVYKLASDYNLATMDEYKLVRLSNLKATNLTYRALKATASNESLSEATSDINNALLVPALACLALECMEESIRLKANSLLFIKQGEITRAINDRSTTAEANKLQLQNSTPISFE